MATCGRPECTVAATGKCLLNNDPNTCPERRERVDVPKLGPDIGDPTAPVLERPSDTFRFPAGLALTVAGADRLRSATSARLVGILGSPDAGKTAVLVSLYLLLSKAQLGDYEFANSETLMAFEELSRGSREWNQGAPPEQMTAHTTLTDERAAGFLHIKVKHSKTGAASDLLLPDLPGEWTTSLIDSVKVDRFSFLKSADVLWLIVDGRQLRATETSNLVLHRLSLLVRRLAAFLAPSPPEAMLVVSHRDHGSLTEVIRNRIEREVGAHGIKVQVVEVASFSDDDQLSPGFGIVDLMDATVAAMPTSRPSFWPTRPRSLIARNILSYDEAAS